MAAPRGGAAADRRWAWPGPTVTSLGSLWGGGPLGRGDHPRQLGQHGHDRPGSRRASRRPRPPPTQILDQLGDGDQVALLVDRRPGVSRRRTSSTARRTRSARCSASAASATSGPTWRRSSSRPASCWPSPTPPTSRSTCSPTCRELSWEGLEGGRRKAEGGRSEDRPLGAAERDPNLTPESANAPSPAVPIPIIVVDCNRTPKPNVAVQGRRPRGRGAGGRPAGQGDRRRC